jgi:hypothetical protein
MRETKKVDLRGGTFLVIRCTCGSAQCTVCDGGPGDTVVTDDRGNEVNPHKRIAVLEAARACSS